MMKYFSFIFLSFLLAAGPAFSNANDKTVSVISEAEFIQLVNELSPKVDAYQAIWKNDPRALIFGGSSRDFLYWVKKQFSGISTRTQAETVIKHLRGLIKIETRDFMMQDSDIDIASHIHATPNGKEFGVTGIHSINPDRINMNTEIGRNEVIQGYIPAEKIAIGKNGLRHLPQFGNGVAEIFSGKLSVHYGNPDDFENTFYARQKINHPVLLALRFIRLLAMDYYYNYGRGFPKVDPLKGVSAENIKQTTDIIQNAWEKAELTEHVRQPKFVEWLNGTISKAFRSYANPTAAKMLMEKFNVGKLGEAYSQIKVINHFLYAKNYDQGLITKNLETLRVNVDAFYLDIMRELPDGYLYHGTRSDDAFKNIVSQGNIPSASGSAGAGVYAVNKNNVKFAVNWTGDSTGDLVAKLHIRGEAKLVDITRGEGKRVFTEWAGTQVGRHFDDIHDSFAEAFGVDIISYPYTPRAYVIKNSDAIDATEGYTRQVLSLSRAIVEMRSVDSVERLMSFYKSVAISKFTPQEIHAIGNVMTFQPTLAEVLAATKDRKIEQSEAYILMKALKETVLVRAFVNSRPRNREIQKALFFDFFDIKSNEQLALLLENLDRKDELFLRDQVMVAAKTLEISREALPLWQGALLSLDSQRLRIAVGGIFAAEIKPSPVAKDNLEQLGQFLNHSDTEIRGYWALMLFEQGERGKKIVFDNIMQFSSLLNLDGKQKDEDFSLGSDKFGKRDKERLLGLLHRAILENHFLEKFESKEALQGYVNAIGRTRVLFADPKICLENLNQINFQPLMAVEKKDAAYVVSSLINVFSRLRVEVGNIQERQSLLDVFRIKVTMVLKTYPLATIIDIEEIFNRGLTDVSLFYGIEISPEIENEMLLLMQEGRGFQRWTAALMILNNHNPSQEGLKNLAVQAVNEVLKTARFDKEKAYLGSALKTQGLPITEFVDWIKFTFATLIQKENISDKEVREIVLIDFIGWEAIGPKTLREIEELRMQLAHTHLKGRVGFETLQQLILTEGCSEWTKLAAARTLRVSYGKGDLELLAMKLKAPKERTGLSRFFEKKESMFDILSRNEGRNLKLLVELGLSDSDVADYLVNAILYPNADPKTGSVILPSMALQYMIRLNLRDKRLLPRLEKELSTVSLKDFNLYFTALVKLFPERGDLIFKTLYNFRMIPSIVVDFLKILTVDHESTALVKSLRQARLASPLSATTSQKIQNLFVDEWLERQLAVKSKKASGFFCGSLFL